MWERLTERLAVHLGVWALKRLYGADCKIDVRDEYPGEDVRCPSCDAKRLIDEMKTLLTD